MFRRLSSSALAVAAVRFYTPSEALKKLYASDFDKAAFPLSIVPSDSVLFAQFLYKAAEPEGNFDAILKDLQAIAAASSKFPIFWERTTVVEEVAEFKKLSEPTFFTMVWMQKNGMLDLLPEVAEVFEAYVNAKQKKAVAKIYVAPGKEGDLAEAKRVAQELHKEAKELAGHTLVFKTVVDRSIVTGFAVELAGQYVNRAEGQQHTSTVDEADYTTVPPPRLPKTVWADNIETEVLRRYLDSLAEYDAEELKHGV
ncbi:ATP synthase OSCP delta subunit-like protein [Trypanosoma conorhini]|uniref:ATP synthase OSCP delta subunit-like protein n=1 Tax=Trypanosoma conorhini TaxID=83891 RepID=A0A3R7M4S6_9TRYP|nr:ATP synthase OSCP delta subunit-like protein [Trypanosoma conorhini]RNE99425.1 ATP synthase OSCP delta subunit-like protein [Trypanosoma conorhini]